MGIEAIPKRFIDNLELKDIILEIADDLYRSADDKIFENHIDDKWAEKYRWVTTYLKGIENNNA